MSIKNIIMLFFFFCWDYSNIFFLCIVFILLLILVLSVLTVFLSMQKTTNEKISIYECGFETFNIFYLSQLFTIDFKKILILFMIFEVEFIFFFP